MRSGAWLWAMLVPTAVLSSGACSGGYPLEPTRCDDWCDATHGPLECYETKYDPAGCVSRCEGLSLDLEQCRGQFDAAVSCYRTTPDAKRPVCYYNYNPDPTTFEPPPQGPCDAPKQALLNCVGAELQIVDIIR
jgi:hypothetical protein